MPDLAGTQALQTQREILEEPLLNLSILWRLEKKQFEQSWPRFAHIQQLTDTCSRIFWCLLIGTGCWFMAFQHQQLAKNVRSHIDYLTDQFQIQHGQDGQSEASSLKNMGSQLVQTFEEAVEMARAIGKEEYNQLQLEGRKQSTLTSALQEAADQLKSVAEREKLREWELQSLTVLSDLLANNQQANLDELFFLYLRQIIQQVGANQGAIFVLEGEKSEHKLRMLRQAAAYAYERRKFVQKSFSEKVGLIGQCIQEKAVLHLNKIPDNYLEFTSGLGHSPPGFLMIVPIVSQGEVFGAVELATFKKLENHQVQLVTLAFEKLGQMVAGIQNARRTEKLLEEARKANEELIAAEELMRSSNEELFQAQEDLSVKMVELEEEANLIKRIFEAIDKTNAFIEFDTQGNILHVNPTFLSVMGYPPEELIGRHETVLLPPDEAQTERYQMMWDTLRTGAFIEGEFTRISKHGQVKWLKGTYNPIADRNGHLLKVIQLMYFTTEEKEKDHRQKNRLKLLNESFPILETNLLGQIKKINPLFSEQLGFQPKDIRNLFYYDILLNELNQPLDNTLVEHLTPDTTMPYLVKIKAAQGTLHTYQAYVMLTSKVTGEPETLFFLLTPFVQEKNLKPLASANPQ
jgi:PAS domain S-box-containing protein